MRKSLNNGRFINLGLDKILPENSIIGIFDLDSVTVKKDSRDFIGIAQRQNQIEDVTTDLPVTFILCSDEGKKQKVILSSFSLPTLHAHMKRKFP